MGERRRWVPRPGIKPGAIEALIATDEGGYMSDEIGLQCTEPARPNANHLRKRPVISSCSESDREESPHRNREKRRKNFREDGDSNGRTSKQLRGSKQLQSNSQGKHC